MSKAVCVLVAALLLTGCAWQDRMAGNATASAYDVRPLRGQATDQVSADVEVCRAKIIDEKSWVEHAGLTYPAVDPISGIAFLAAAEAQRASRFERCMADLGYATELRPMTGGPAPAR